MTTRIPTTILTGFLGVGKTTALLSLFEHRPPNERWAVIVNEFGEVGIDGAVLAAAGGVAVREIPGGCVCCTSGPMLQVAMAQVIREQKPDRILMEPTGLAMPAGVIDMLRRPGFRDAVDLRAVITLIDPRKWREPRYAEHDVWRSQVQTADLLVANKCDLASAEQIQTFVDDAAAMYPPKVAVHTVEHGLLDPAWLDTAPAPEVGLSFRIPEHGVEAGFSSHGWQFPPSVVFHRGRLEKTLQELLRPCSALPQGLERLKGVFHLPGVWSLAQGTPDRLSFHPVGHRRDSRVDLIAPADPAPDWDAVGRALDGAKLTAADVRRGEGR